MRNCPICKRKLVMREDPAGHVDYNCEPSMTNHHFFERLKNDEVSIIKMRLTSDKYGKLFLKVDYENKCSEIWTKPNDANKLKINNIIEPDYNDLSKLESKIRTYLILS